LKKSSKKNWRGSIFYALEVVKKELEGSPIVMAKELKVYKI